MTTKKQLNSKYKKLIMLKKALNINSNTEINEDILIKFSNQNNSNEIFLINYLVKQTLNAPKIIKQQNAKLINAYKNKKHFALIIKETAELYNTHPRFAAYKKKIINALELDISDDKYRVNSILYDICRDLITDTITLNPDDICLNLHILQCWLMQQKKIKLKDVAPEIIFTIILLSHGYLIEEIANLGILNTPADNEKEYMENIIFNIIPAQFDLSSISQLMAIIFAHNRYL